MPLLVTLLAAAWFLQPWSVATEIDYVNGAEATEQQQVYSPANTQFRVSRMENMELAEEARARASLSTPAPTPTPTPEPTPAPTPAPKPVSASSLSSAQVQALVCSYGWPCEQALSVMWCESGGRASAIGRGVNYGLFQINQVHARHIAGFWDAWMDPAANTKWAFDLWSRSGWRPWACRYAALR
jgi:Lysozyme like domain